MPRRGYGEAMCPEGLPVRPVGIARPAEGFSIFDIFAPTQENPRTRTSSSTIGDLRTIERKEKRAIEYQIFLEISSSYLAFVLQS